MDREDIVKLNTAFTNRDWDKVKYIIGYNLDTLNHHEISNIISSTPLVKQLIIKMYSIYLILYSKAVRNKRDFGISPKEKIELDKLAEVLKEIKEDEIRNNISRDTGTV